MSELVVVGFDGTEVADRVLLKLAGLKKEYLVDLEDAVVVVRDEDGKVHLKQSVNLTAIGASSGFLSGGLWGGLVGLLFLNPLAGFAIGGAIGAASGPYYGYDDGYGPGYADYAYEEPGAVAVGPSGGDAESYCAQRFRSYDPATGTYLGYDGMRHPCP